MVFVDRLPRGLSAVSVVEDDLSGARQAVAHLARHGHRRIALVGVSTYVTTTRRRLEGYRAAVRGNGLASDPSLVCLGSESRRRSRERLRRSCLSLPEPPTAVFSVSIPCTMALIHALQTAGRTDVALVGFGDFPMADALSPAVTVIDQDPAQLGRVAVDRMTNSSAMPGRQDPRKTVLPVRPDPTRIRRTERRPSESVRSAEHAKDEP